MFKRLITILGFEFYALLLVAWHMHIGVRTDEAKYLLDIPYPHPPLIRYILSLLDGWAYQELFWRVVFATLLIQAVWLILDLLKGSKMMQIAGAACWLLSASVLLQAGTVMMVVVTALQALMLVWLLLHDRPSQPYLIALLWLFCLFSAYQIVLFGPLVFALLRKSKTTVITSLVLIGVPLALLALYTLTNPLVIASMANQAGKDASETLIQRVVGTFSVWSMGGGVVLSAIGTIGIFLRPKAGLFLSFILVLAYVFLARYDYYALLFTPLFMAGAVLLLRERYLFPVAPLVLMPIGLIASLLFISPGTTSIVPQVYGALDGLMSDVGTVLINGSFGHEWQYGTSRTVLRYRPSLTDGAAAMICLQPCTQMQGFPVGQTGQTDWKRLEDVPVEVWVRRP